MEPAVAMKPLWKIRSGSFAGWRDAEDQLYAPDGTHVGYFVEGIAYVNEGRAIGELYGENKLGRRENVIYPTGTRQASREAKHVADAWDTTGLPVSGWVDPGL
jgi:hypothetical protein